MILFLPPPPPPPLGRAKAEAGCLPYIRKTCMLGPASACSCRNFSLAERTLMLPVWQCLLCLIIQSLGEIATARFTCGGTILTPPKVQLVYLTKTGVWSAASFPGLQNAEFLQILESLVLEKEKKQLLTRATGMPTL